jgi:hypothetical protein
LKINPQKMTIYFDKVLSGLKQFVFFLFLIINVYRLQAQPPVDPNSPGGAVNLPPAQLYEALKDKNPDGGKSTIGIDNNKALRNKITTDSLVRENTPQSANITETTYGMQLFTSGVVASISDLSTPPLDYPIGVYDQIIVSLWNGAEATLDYTVARDGSIFKV